MGFQLRAPVLLVQSNEDQIGFCLTPDYHDILLLTIRATKCHHVLQLIEIWMSGTDGVLGAKLCFD